MTIPAKLQVSFLTAIQGNLVFIPHWNNKDGGIELDTSRCYMGQSRFTDLMELLPEDLTILGIDENTALVFDLKAGMGRVSGLGGVTLVHADYDQRSPISDLSVLEPVGASGHRKAYARRVGRNQTFLLSEYCPFKWPPTWHGVAPDVWEKALDAQARMDQQRRKLSQTGEVFQTEEEPAEIQALSTARNEARERRDWATADDLRREIEAMGWKLVDTPEGTKLMRNILVDESRSE